jgi:uncharacterized protein YqgC (DUF456 family)
MDWQTIGNVTVHILAGLTMVVGWLSLLIVIVPGLVIMWVGALGYGIFTGFDTTGWIIFAIMTILMVVGSLIDNFLMGASARQKGASWWSLGAAWVGAIIGTIVLPPIGGLIFALLALFLVEYFQFGDRLWVGSWRTIGNRIYYVDFMDFVGVCILKISNK